MIEALANFAASTGFAMISWENLAMFAIAGVLTYLAIAKNAEPLLLIPISFGIIMANIPPQATGLF